MGTMTPYYQRGGITIYCGDCLEVMPWLVGAGVVVDAIIADLPYGTTACSWDTVIPFEPLWANYKALVKRAGAVVLFGSQPFTSKLVTSNLEWFKYEWIWEKTRPSGYVHAKNKPLKIHENVLVFSPGFIAHENKSEYRIAYSPQDLTFRPKYSFRPGRRNKSNVSFGSRPSSKDGWTQEYENYPNSILKIQNLNTESLHPTQKPVALLQYLTRTYTNPNDLILDNTMGSGTTLLAAQNEGRQAIGIETSEEYCAIAVDRLKQPSFFSIPDKPKPARITQGALI